MFQECQGGNFYTKLEVLRDCPCSSLQTLKLLLLEQTVSGVSSCGLESPLLNIQGFGQLTDIGLAAWNLAIVRNR